MASTWASVAPPRMSSADARRLANLDARILKLRQERRALITASHDRAIMLSQAQLEKLAAANRSAAERGYPRPRAKRVVAP